MVGVIAPDGGIAGEGLKGGIQAEFGLLHTGDKHLVMEVQQFCMAVLNTIAVELHKPAALKGRSWSGSARLGRWARFDGEGAPGQEGRMHTLHVRGLRLPGGCCRWDQSGAFGAVPRGQLPVVCSGMDSSAAAVTPLVERHEQEGNPTSIDKTATNWSWVLDGAWVQLNPRLDKEAEKVENIGLTNRWSRSFFLG